MNMEVRFGFVLRLSTGGGELGCEAPGYTVPAAIDALADAQYNFLLNFGFMYSYR